MSKRIDYAGVVLSLDPEQEERKQVRTQLQWDYGQVPALHRKAVEDAAVEIAVNGRKMTASVMGIGDALIRVKGLLAHGQFEEWCRVEFGMSERTAQNMMNVARTFAGKSAKISLLSDSTLYLLAAPSTPEPVREAVIAQAEATGRSPSVAEVRKSIRLFVENLRGIVRLWAEEHWLRSGREIPPNPSHTNGQFWQELTAWLHGNVTDTWTEGDLKAAINQEYRYEARAAQLAQAPVKVELPTAAPVTTAPVPLRRLTPTDHEIAVALEDWLATTDASWDELQAMRRETWQHPLWQKMIGAIMAACRTVVGLNHATVLKFLDEELGEPDTAPAPELAASDFQVMQAAPAAHGINGAFVRTHEAATGDARLGKMRRLVSLYETVANSFDEFGELTGRDTETLAAGREMRKLIGWLEREISLLEGREVEPLEGESEGWG